MDGGRGELTPRALRAGWKTGGKSDQQDLRSHGEQWLDPAQQSLSFDWRCWCFQISSETRKLKGSLIFCCLETSVRLLLDKFIRK